MNQTERNIRIAQARFDYAGPFKTAERADQVLEDLIASARKYRTIGQAQWFARTLSQRFAPDEFKVVQHPTDFGWAILCVSSSSEARPVYVGS